MILGITGTRNGFTSIQLNAFRSQLIALLNKHEVTAFSQGQCIGVDVTAANLVHFLSRGKVAIRSHPPLKRQLVGDSHVDVVLPAKNHLARNRCIVDESDILFVCPSQEEHQSTGGTWYTYDYAMSKNKPVILITPSGTIQHFNM